MFVGAGAVVVQCVNVGTGSFIRVGEVYGDERVYNCGSRSES